MQSQTRSWIVLLLLVVTTPCTLRGAEATISTDQQKREYLKSILYSPQAVEDWLAGDVLWGEAFHPILGWTHNERTIHHGVDGSFVSYHYDADGARRVMAYADGPCRIHTYGDSFTSCEQVNDGETWQEYLAAHLQEPIRNFGIGGYSVYQSYRRMLLQEAETPAQYIVFNIYSDDHYRNLTGWRNIRHGSTPTNRNEVSSPPLPYVKVNPATKQFIEVQTPCPTPESARRLSDLDWVFDQFKDDFTLKVVIAQSNIRAGTPALSYAEIGPLAAEHGWTNPVDSLESLKEAVDAIFTNAGLYASMRIVEKVEAYAAEHHKNVLYVLSYGNKVFRNAQRSGSRFDQPFVDFMNAKQLSYVDLMQAHAQDFAERSIDVDQYVKRYWIGHYRPSGNFFAAMAMKDKLVDMLNPEPLSYNPSGKVTFESPWEGGAEKAGR